MASPVQDVLLAGHRSKRFIKNGSVRADRSKGHVSRLSADGLAMTCGMQNRGEALICRPSSRLSLGDGSHEEHDQQEARSALAQQVGGRGGGHEARAGFTAGEGQVEGNSGQTERRRQGEGDREPDEAAQLATDERIARQYGELGSILGTEVGVRKIATGLVVDVQIAERRNTRTDGRFPIQ